MAGGTWLGVNECGLVAGVLNRRASNGLDPLSPTRSRGLLCTDLLKLRSAAAARAFISRHQETYQPFTVVVADPREAWIAYNLPSKIETHGLEQGLHVYSSASEISARSEKADRAHSQFAHVLEELGANCRDKPAWVWSLRTVLGDHKLGNGAADPREAICVHGEVSGTVSSTVIFFDQPGHQFCTFTCSGTPCRTEFGEAFVLKVR